MRQAGCRSSDGQHAVTIQRMVEIPTIRHRHLCCRFRASSKMGDMTYEHPQNVTLSQIIVANEGIVQASQAQPPPDSSGEDAEVRHQQFSAAVTSALQARTPPGTPRTACMAMTHRRSHLEFASINCWPCNAPPHYCCSCCRGSNSGIHESVSQMWAGTCSLLQAGDLPAAAAAAVPHSCAWCLQAFRKDAAGRTLKLWLDLQTAVSALYDSSLGSKYADKAPVSTDHRTNGHPSLPITMLCSIGLCLLSPLPVLCTVCTATCRPGMLWCCSCRTPGKSRLMHFVE